MKRMGNGMGLKQALIHQVRGKRRRMSAEADMIRAAEEGQFELVYQPVIDLSGGEVLGWEALIRWHHPDRGLVSPAEFIPAAEESGAILAVGGWIINRACENFAHVLDKDRSSRWISVNISESEFRQHGFADTVRKALKHSGVEAHSLVLEITDAALARDRVRAVAALASLREAGVRIALDGFGSGPSSLDDLKEMPVDIIKIDRSVTTIGGEAAVGMLEATVALGTKLGLGMIAEGIEESAVLERIRSFEGVAGQGYFLARPMSLFDARSFTYTSLPSQ